jgi:hypothetical protein
MIYDKGTIIKKKNIRFKQTDMIDFRLGGHPVLFPVDFGFDDNFFYFFTLSSGVEYYTKDPNRYFLLKKGSGSGLKTNSIVDLKYVYKCKAFNDIPEGKIPDWLNLQIINKFKSYEGIVIDTDCEEFLNILETSKV